MKTLIKYIIIWFVTFFNLKCTDDSGLVDYIFFSDDVKDISAIGVGDGKGDNIIIKSPLPGIILNESDGVLVEWEIIGNISSEDITIGISVNGGATWQDIHGSGYAVHNPIDDNSYYYEAGNWTSVDNDGSYNVYPNIFKTSNKVLIGIWSKEAYEEHYKVLNDYITITADSNYLEIISPNGFQSITMNQTYNISWISGGDISYDALNIYYNVYDIDDENSWILIVNNTRNDGSYNWTVPSFTSTRSNCRVKIVDSDNPDIYDISDNNFTITQ